MASKESSGEDDGSSSEPIALAERLIEVLDEGSITGTYKFAVLLALLDCCLEQAGTGGRAPDRIATRTLARRVLELYWPHTNEFSGLHGAVELRQNSSNQAAILNRIRRFRQQHGPEHTMSVAQSEHLAAGAFSTLLDFAEWKLAEMPLPRVQYLGSRYEPFLYEIDWGATESGATITRQHFRDGAVRRELRLQPGVAGELLRLHGLLRPLIERHWATTVARFNQSAVGDYELDSFLFGRPRTPTGRLRAALRELQGNRCFYCDRPLTKPEVDHFLPWSRHPDDGVHNLVVADAACNRDKRRHLAATEHVAAWREHLRSQATAMDELAVERHWPAHADRTLGAVRAVYLNIPEDSRLWRAVDTFVAPDLSELARILHG